MGLSTGSLSVLTTWQLASSRASDKRGRERKREVKEEAIVPFYDLVLEVTHCHFCHILFTRNESLSLAHMHAEVNQVPAAERRRIKEFLDTYENHLIGQIAHMVLQFAFFT